MRILVTAVGFHDPFSDSLVDGEQQAGPIISLVLEEHFDRVILVSNEKTMSRAQDTREAIINRREGLDVHVEKIHVPDPLNYIDILSEFRRVTRPLLELEEATFFVSVSSGTPSMHACWLLLAASGEFPATILNVRPSRFVTASNPLVYEVDLTASQFPQVRVRQGVDDPGSSRADLLILRERLGVVGNHGSILEALQTASALSGARVPALILGETGTGKELFARLIHLLGDGNRKPWVVVNCASIPKDLVESELFGHARGAFTGATQERRGKFEEAHEGTLFLDEVGELPPSAQAKLLRVLQEGEITRVGENRVRTVDVRVVAATNRELTSASYRRESEFREDLYHRLNVGVFRLPSLKERREDVPVLALHFVDMLSEKMGRRKTITQAALTRLMGHPWPGNIRELRNTIERTILLHPGPKIDAEDIKFAPGDAEIDVPEGFPEPDLGAKGFTLPSYLDDVRDHLVRLAVSESAGNQSQAARLLGMSPQAINKHLKRIS